MSKPIVTGIFEGFRVLVDPDDPSRKPGPVTVYVMTNEQREKYMSKGEDKKMATKEAEVRKIETAETETKGDSTPDKITKAAVLEMAGEGKTEAEIIDYFLPAYPPSTPKKLIMAKVALYLRGPKPKEPTAETAAIYKKNMPYKSSIAFAPESTTQRLRPTGFRSSKLDGVQYAMNNGNVRISREYTKPDDTTVKAAGHFTIKETELDTLVTDLHAIIDTLAMYKTTAKQEAATI